MDATEELKVKPTPVCLTPELLRKLDARAKREGLFRGRSVLIRRACEKYLRDIEQEAA